MQPERLSTRIALADDHALFAQALGIVLGAQGCDVVRVPLPGAEATVAQLVRAVLASHPELVLLDLDLGRHGSGSRLIAPLTAEGVAVVVVTADPDPARWGECLEAGARTVIAKERPLTDVLTVVRRLEQGLPVLTQDERDHHVELWHRRLELVRDRRRRLESLTRREAQVLAQLIEGQQVRDIARVSVVSEATVRTQVKSILAKLEVHSQLGAVGLARQSGWSPAHISR